MRQFLPCFVPEEKSIADDVTLASSSNEDGTDGFMLENKIWVLKNFQAKYKIIKNESTKRIISRLNQ